MPLLKTLLLLLTLASPALAQSPPSDGAALAAAARDAANQLQTYLDGVAKAGGRPDFSKPPAADLFGRVFDLKQLAALPPSTPADIAWQANWTGTTAQMLKSLMYFGITPPVGPGDVKTLERNMADFEDQEAVETEFLVRLTARQISAVSVFMAQLPPDQRTPMREDGFTTSRIGAEKTIDGALTMLTGGLKPANERRISAALSDTREAYTAASLPKDRPQILSQLTRVQKAVSDGDARKNLVTFGAALAATK
jgi:hypothetical protein